MLVSILAGGSDIGDIGDEIWSLLNSDLSLMNNEWIKLGSDNLRMEFQTTYKKKRLEFDNKIIKSTLDIRLSYI